MITDVDIEKLIRIQRKPKQVNQDSNSKVRRSGGKTIVLGGHQNEDSSPVNLNRVLEDDDEEVTVKESDIKKNKLRPINKQEG